MSKRTWDNLDPSKTYLMSFGDGWVGTPNGDGTVSISHPASARAAATTSVNMTIDPDPGKGKP